MIIRNLIAMTCGTVFGVGTFVVLAQVLSGTDMGFAGVMAVSMPTALLISNLMAHRIHMALNNSL